MKSWEYEAEPSTWTPYRTEIDQVIKDNGLRIAPLGITQWREIEYAIIKHFTGKSSGFSWMWENSILADFDRFTREISDFATMAEMLSSSIDQDEQLWLFMEDSVDFRPKYWGYTGVIGDILTLLGDSSANDFYIVSKKLKWVTGQNHEDVLFGYGEIAGRLRALIG